MKARNPALLQLLHGVRQLPRLATGSRSRMSAANDERRQASKDTRSLKVKVFDLEAVRRHQIHPLDQTEVLVGCQYLRVCPERGANRNRESSQRRR